MNRRSESLLVSAECHESQLDADSPSPAPLPMHHSVPEDDRYPGTFFRVPRMPVAGKTSWGLTQ
jgi:hypothetical protein